jgi:hypothetical protein
VRATLSALSIKPQGLNCCAMAKKREGMACFYFNKTKKVLLSKSEFHGMEIIFYAFRSVVSALLSPYNIAFLLWA